MGATMSQNSSPRPTASATTLTTTATTRGEEISGNNGEVIKAAAKSSSNINDLDHQKVSNQNGRVGSSVPSPASVPQLQSNDNKKKTEEEEKQKHKENEKEKEKKKEPNTNKQAFILSMGLPHNYHNIIKDADDADKYMNTNNGSRGGGGGQRDVHSDVFLNKKTKKYWVDSYGHNCFMLLARDLTIVWGDDQRYWHWPSIKESSTSTSGEVFIDVAELSNVCWLEVHGKLNTSNLSPEIKYEVLFMVMLKDPAYGWEVPVNLRLTLPDGTKQEHKENLQTKLREQWVDLYVGEFQAPSSAATAAAGDIEISMFEYAGGKWKRGLVIKGIIVRPKQTKRV